jgi:hypothetical protein
MSKFAKVKHTITPFGRHFCTQWKACVAYDAMMDMYYGYVLCGTYPDNEPDVYPDKLGALIAAAHSAIEKMRDSA